MFTLEIVRRIRDAKISTKVVVLSTRRDRKTVVEALRCGVNALSPQVRPARELLEAFEQILTVASTSRPQLERQLHFFRRKQAFLTIRWRR